VPRQAFNEVFISVTNGHLFTRNGKIVNDRSSTQGDTWLRKVRVNGVGVKFCNERAAYGAASSVCVPINSNRRLKSESPTEVPI
jgi:hypothetical protein